MCCVNKWFDCLCHKVITALRLITEIHGTTDRIRDSMFSIPLHCFGSSVCHHMLSMSLGLLLSKPSRDLTYWVCQNMQWQSGALRKASIMTMESQYFCTVISVYEISWACRRSVADFQDSRLTWKTAAEIMMMVYSTLWL